MIAERRILPRWKIEASAKIKWDDTQDYLHCEAVDLNMKGVCLATPNAIPEGKNFLEICFNEKYFFGLGVSVVWHKEIAGKQIYGLKFLKVRDYDKEKIYQMMTENFPNLLTKAM